MSFIIDPDRLQLIISAQLSADDLSQPELEGFCIYANKHYRAGTPVISDYCYDHEFLVALEKINPEHDLLTKVEPESVEEFSGERVKHPRLMLSTEKSYTDDEVNRWLSRILKAASEVGVSPAHISIRLTAKLDGLAGRDDGTVLSTRGDGYYGYDVTSAFDRGVVPMGGRGLGRGELVVHQPYFEKVLSGEFAHGRNFMVGLVNSDNLNKYAEQALLDQAAHFVPYSWLPSWEGSLAEFRSSLTGIIEDLRARTEYAQDGMVAEVVNESVRERMGATSHHYRYQLAIKEKGETAAADVIEIIPQTSRKGRVTPVLHIEPTQLSGAVIRRVTAHHYGMVARMKLGAGASILLIRSGEVVPHIEQILRPASVVDIPEHCPSCGHKLVWENVFLMCLNRAGCRAQIENTLQHFFSILGSADLFGPKTIEKLVENSVDTLEKIYACSVSDFEAMGFGPGQSVNLAREMNRSITQQVEDWRFLAAFGIHNLGRGAGRKLLAVIPLQDLPSASKSDIEAIHGFGDITSEVIVLGIKEQWNTISHLLSLGFNLDRTALSAEATVVDSPISGKGIVFTGSMTSGSSREEMQHAARDLGAKIQTSVSKTGTDILVCGNKVGPKKIEKAELFGVKVISEMEYLALIA